MPHGELSVTTTSRRQMIDLTDQLMQVVAETGVEDGLLFVYNPHTTAGLLINEGADPDVQRDILGALDRIVPASYPYRHAEGNSPAHVMAALTGSSVTIHIHRNRLRLGTWQRLFFCEFDGPRSRKVWWKSIAD